MVVSATSRGHRPGRTGLLHLGLLFLVGGLVLLGCSSSGAVSKKGQSSSSPPEQSEDEKTISSDSSSITTRTPSRKNVEPEKVLRLPKVSKRLEQAAQDWYGVPYKWGGSSKQGVDCSAFVQSVYKEAFSIKLPRVTETQVQTGSRVPRDQIRPGDLVFFKPENQYNHVGVYMGEGEFAHASSSSGVTKSPIRKNYWDRYYWTSRRPLKPSRVPDSLASQLVAYQYPDTTVHLADAGEATAPGEGSTESSAQAETKIDKEETKEGSPSSSSSPQSSPNDGEKTAEAKTPKLASCREADVDCAESSSKQNERSGSSGDRRKGW